MFNRCKKSKLTVPNLLVFVVLILVSWKSDYRNDWMWIQRLLLQGYNQSATMELKKWDLSVTPEGFFRLRKQFPSGKKEFFSFNFKRVADISYDGSTDSGEIVFITSGDDIIVQTYNDPKGNIDSMASVLRIPVINIGKGQVDSLKNTVLKFKD